MLKILQNTMIVAMATVGSRFLGLLRDILLFAFLGATALNSAFILAFTLPNLFRRLLGEGVLTSALVPMLSEELEENEKGGAFRFLNQVGSRVFLVLVGLVALGSGIFVLVDFVPGLPPRWYLSADLAKVLLPYMLFACMAAVLAAGLNVLQRFGVTALSQVWLNLAMILALGLFGTLLSDTAEGRVYFLCGGVLVGGAVQVVIPALALRTEGWKPRFNFKTSVRLREMWRLFLPGVAGAALYQVNIVVIRLLAFWLNEEAVSILYLSNRLLELPLGVFAITVTTVFFPNLARFAAGARFQEYGKTFHQGLQLIFVFIVPAATGLIILRNPILELLFAWGAFGVRDVALTTPVLAVFAVALPFYALSTFTTAGFHALKDMQTPVRLIAVSLVLNLGLSLLFIRPLGMIGLALANLLATLIHSMVLFSLLWRKEPHLQRPGFWPPLLKIFLATAVMAVFTRLVWHVLEVGIRAPKIAALAALLGLIPMAVLLYFGLLWAMRFEGVKEVRAFLTRWTK